MVESVRKACPKSSILCIVPPLGWHASEIAGAVADANGRGDDRVHLIDTSQLKGIFNVNGATKAASDGVHPTIYGSALLAALIAAEVQKVLVK